MILKIILGIVGVIVLIVLGFLLFGIFLSKKADARRKEFLKTHPQSPLTEAKKRLLSFGAPLFLFRHEDVFDIVCSGKLEEYAYGLKQQWEIENRETALETLQALLEMRKSQEIDHALSTTENQAAAKEIKAQIANGLKVNPNEIEGVQSAYAWDICRLISLSKWCYWLDYITEEEMWKLMEQAAKKATTIGKDWDEYIVSFLLGRTVQGFELEEIVFDCQYLYQRNKTYSGGQIYDTYSFKE